MSVECQKRNTGEKNKINIKQSHHLFFFFFFFGPKNNLKSLHSKMDKEIIRTDKEFTKN